MKGNRRIERNEYDGGMEPKADFFDRLMNHPPFKVFQPFYIQHKEVLMYLLFGGVAFFLNIGLFALLDRVVGMNELVNNAICWIICVLFQFFTNRTWVFDGHVDSTAEFMRQALGFFGGRIFTLVVEEMLLAIFITWMGCNAIAVKLVAQVIVIIQNYFISKVLVFRKHGN